MPLRTNGNWQWAVHQDHDTQIPIPAASHAKAATLLEQPGVSWTSQSSPVWAQQQRQLTHCVEPTKPTNCLSPCHLLWTDAKQDTLHTIRLCANRWLANNATNEAQTVLHNLLWDTLCKAHVAEDSLSGNAQKQERVVTLSQTGDGTTNCMAVTHLWVPFNVPRLVTCDDGSLSQSVPSSSSIFLLHSSRTWLHMSHVR